MSKKKEESPFIIKENEYIEELEKDVRYHLSMSAHQHPNYTKYTREEYPKFTSQQDEFNYQLREIDRCQKGYNGMCGKMYFWHNYCWLRDPELGKIRPQYRTVVRDWFQFIEDHQKQEDKTGIVAIKRRRVGASWMAAADVLHDCIFKPYYQVGMNSKGEKDSRDLFKHVKFIYQNLPEWLRPRSTASDRRDYMEFAWHEKDGHGNRSKKGNQSWIVSVAPTDNSHEGSAYSKLIIDEAGKIPNLLTIWSYAQDCLMKPPRRVGLPIIFGTVGDITKDGYGLKEMWINHEIYKLDRFFFYGYNAMDGMIDEYGNDMKEHAIRYIIYERHRLRHSKKELEAFIQKYPLTEKDAFNQMSGGGVGDIQKINEQITNLMVNPPQAVTGWMRRKPNGVDFVPSPDGEVIIYERPQAIANGYKGVTDPADDDNLDKTRDTSDICTGIGKKAFGLEPVKLVARLCHRPKLLDEHFEQAAMLCEWYGCQITIEMNKGGWRMKKYFEDHYPHLLALSPVSGTSAKGGVEWKIGVKMTTDRKEQMKGLMEDNIDNHVKWMQDIKLLEQHKVFGDDHADDDLAIMWGWMLILMQSDKTVAKAKEQAIAHNPTASYQKTSKGIQRTIGGKPVQSHPMRGKSALFR